ncbi:MAG: GNAT family N-acetyltransferase [Candidatus Thermoplasmatota archaeon]|nr:GNAT family N-acetyltransferase [Candidatus Thermoplasmatota archaeon]
MAEGSDQDIRVNLVSISSKEEFLTTYMSYRMEQMGNGVQETAGGSKLDQLSKFWNDPNNNYLLWFMKGTERIGFAAITLKDLENGMLDDMVILREHRNKGYGKKALVEIKKFVSYRGLKELTLGKPIEMEWLKDIFIKGGFVESDGKLKVELSLYKPV